MSRPLKFRAWTGQQMIDVPILDIAGVGENGYTVLTPKTHYANVPVMQYTGLKDKNGKEIYEGDIIDWHLDKGDIAVVRYEPELAMFVGKWSREHFQNPLVDFSKPEVIGNIYENGDLIK